MGRKGAYAVKGSKKLLNAWASYDWANSVYPLVISTAVFPIYYGAICADQLYLDIFGHSIKNTALISFVTAFAFIVIASLSPLLSGIADYVGNKKRFMQFYCYLGSLSCMGLYWFELESLQIGLTFYFFALIGFWSSLVFYNSYLPDIAHPEQQDRVSAKGYALGYFGSVLLLVFNLAMVMKPELFGITGSETEASLKAMRYSFITVGVWWMTFSQYAFYHLPMGNSGNKVTRSVVMNGYKELKTVYRSLASTLRLKRYLGAFFVYSMALQTVILVATYFGEQEISWGEGEKTIGLIVSIILIQLVGIAGALLTARISKKIGNITTLIALNFIWSGLCVYAFFIETPVQFYMAAGVLGLIFGGIQALSRSTYSKLIPPTEDTASYFSFYDISEKIAIVFGMLLFGFVDQITGSMRNSILFFMVFFFVGALLLNRMLRIDRKNT
jgi:UMF1 family MFS transporter